MCVKAAILYNHSSGDSLDNKIIGACILIFVCMYVCITFRRWCNELLLVSYDESDYMPN